ncbi:MAG: hypothetical protein R6V41_07100 [Desulfobacteraceae bacterium]
METPDTLLAEWKDNESQTRRAFTELLDHIKSMTGIRLDFKARKGVSYSLRPGHRNQTNRELFAMVDVIDDDPDERWISVCFYGDMITDPDETGDLIPEGLLGDDGYCFDLYEYDADEIAYLKKRLDEAYKAASENG